MNKQTESTQRTSRIKRVFDNRINADKVMSLFLTAGFPDLESTAELILGFEKNGAELIELGMPFSDPLADGPTIQEASTIAIQNGITMNKIFEIVSDVRQSSEIPIILMGYINPILRYGVDSFCENAANAGVDGFIIPDVPPEEASFISETAKKHALDMIYLVAPNSSDKRMRMVDEQSSGFVYCVSVTGVTGARKGDEVASSVKRFIHRVKENVTQNPKLVGFGIKNYTDAQVISEQVDGFIVGSALIDVIKKWYPAENWKDELFNFVHHLKYGNQD